MHRARRPRSSCMFVTILHDALAANPYSQRSTSVCVTSGRSNKGRRSAGVKSQRVDRVDRVTTQKGLCLLTSLNKTRPLRSVHLRTGEPSHVADCSALAPTCRETSLRKALSSREISVRDSLLLCLAIKLRTRHLGGPYPPSSNTVDWPRRLGPRFLRHCCQTFAQKCSASLHLQRRQETAVVNPCRLFLTTPCAKIR